MSSVVRVRLHVSSGYAGANHEDVVEIDKEEWESMSEEQQNSLMDDLVIDFRNNVIECSAWVIEEE